MTKPLVSVVIPTHNRPKFLLNAIGSALACAPNGNVEVIVVPNGSDKTWQSTASEFSRDTRVQWHPMAVSNVSAARNYGLKLARGDFIRFLDDDDYLLPAACKVQCEAIILNSADVCSGAIEINRENHTRVKIWQQPYTDDFCVAALAPRRRAQVGCHIFRRKILDKLQWNENSSLNEDMEWLLAVATSNELKWIRTGDIVAAWIQHRHERLSRGHDPGNGTLKYSANLLLTAGEKLSASQRLTSSRRDVLAEALWSLLQKGLKYDFQYWKEVARIADQYAPGRRPPSRIHRTSLVRLIHPLMVETALIPVRYAYAPVQRVLDQLGLNRS